MNSPNLREAARWLATHGPGHKPLQQCRELFDLRPKHFAEVCRRAIEIRSEAYSASPTDGGAE